MVLLGMGAFGSCLAGLSYHEFVCCLYITVRGFPGGPAVKNLHALQETQEMRVPPLGQEDPLEEGMATHSSVLAWRIPWTEEPGELQSTGSQRVGRKRCDRAHTQAYCC